MRTVSIPEARKYCKERGWSFVWTRQYLADGSFTYKVLAAKYQEREGKYQYGSLNSIEAIHPSRQYAIQAVYQAVKLFEETTLKAPSEYIKRTKTRPTRRTKHIDHP